ncbi:MAG: hypothetical protein IJ239_08055 [Eubacterium sp.]|nr:hypothetical protein [Eubacterium sp.]
MLGKLFKYEWKSTVRLLGIMYLAVIICGAVAGFVNRANLAKLNAVQKAAEAAGSTEYIYSGPFDTAVTILMIIYIFLIIAMFVMTVAIIISRFYRNLLSGEGYLMHTLPVPTWMLVISKVLSALFWTVLSVIAAGISGLVMMLTAGLIHSPGAVDFWKEMLFLMQQFNLNTLLTVILVIVEIVCFILMIYFCLLVGNIANRHKIAAAFAAFIGLMILEMILTSIFQIGPIRELIGSSYQYMTPETAAPVQTENLLGNMFLAAEIRQLIIYLVYSVLYFFGTTFMLKKHLNLS